MRGCCWDLWNCRWLCNFKTVGYVIGWFGVVYRTVATIVLSVVISNFKDSEELYSGLCSIPLTYCFVSLASNFLFIVGISKERYNFLVPYLGLYGVEILVGIAAVIIGTIFFIKSERIIVLSYFIPCSVTGVAVYGYFWSCLMRIFVEYKSAVDENSSIRSFESGLMGCSCSCFRTDSLDIAVSQ